MSLIRSLRTPRKFDYSSSRSNISTSTPVSRSYVAIEPLQSPIGQTYSNSKDPKPFVLLENPNSSKLHNTRTPTQKGSDHNSNVDHKANKNSAIIKVINSRDNVANTPLRSSRIRNQNSSTNSLTNNGQGGVNDKGKIDDLFRTPLKQHSTLKTDNLRRSLRKSKTEDNLTIKSSIIHSRNRSVDNEKENSRNVQKSKIPHRIVGVLQDMASKSKSKADNFMEKKMPNMNVLLSNIKENTNLTHQYPAAKSNPSGSKYLENKNIQPKSLIQGKTNVQNNTKKKSSSIQYDNGVDSKKNTKNKSPLKIDSNESSKNNNIANIHDKMNEISKTKLTKQKQLNKMTTELNRKDVNIIEANITKQKKIPVQITSVENDKTRTSTENKQGPVKDNTEANLVKQMKSPDKKSKESKKHKGGSEKIKEGRNREKSQELINTEMPPPLVVPNGSSKQRLSTNSDICGGGSEESLKRNSDTFCSMSSKPSFIRRKLYSQSSDFMDESAKLANTSFLEKNNVRNVYLSNKTQTNKKLSLPNTGDQQLAESIPSDVPRVLGDNLKNYSLRKTNKNFKQYFGEVEILPTECSNSRENASKFINNILKDMNVQGCEATSAEMTQNENSVESDTESKNLSKKGNPKNGCSEKNPELLLGESEDDFSFDIFSSCKVQDNERVSKNKNPESKSTKKTNSNTTQSSNDPKSNTTKSRSSSNGSKTNAKKSTDDLKNKTAKANDLKNKTAKANDLKNKTAKANDLKNKISKASKSLKKETAKSSCDSKSKTAKKTRTKDTKVTKDDNEQCINNIKTVERISKNNMQISKRCSAELDVRQAKASAINKMKQWTFSGGRELSKPSPNMTRVTRQSKKIIVEKKYSYVLRKSNTDKLDKNTSGSLVGKVEKLQNRHLALNARSSSSKNCVNRSITMNKRVTEQRNRKTPTLMVSKTPGNQYRMTSPGYQQREWEDFEDSMQRGGVIAFQYGKRMLDPKYLSAQETPEPRSSYEYKKGSSKLSYNFKRNNEVSHPRFMENCAPNVNCALTLPKNMSIMSRTPRHEEYQHPIESTKLVYRGSMEDVIYKSSYANSKQANGQVYASNNKYPSLAFKSNESIFSDKYSNSVTLYNHTRSHRGGDNFKRPNACEIVHDDTSSKYRSGHRGDHLMRHNSPVYNDTRGLFTSACRDEDTRYTRPNKHTIATHEGTGSVHSLTRRCGDFTRPNNDTGIFSSTYCGGDNFMKSTKHIAAHDDMRSVYSRESSRDEGLVRSNDQHHQATTSRDNRLVHSTYLARNSVTSTYKSNRHHPYQMRVQKYNDGQDLTYSRKMYHRDQYNDKQHAPEQPTTSSVNNAPWTETYNGELNQPEPDYPCFYKQQSTIDLQRNSSSHASTRSVVRDDGPGWWNERPNIEINNRKTTCSMPPPRHYHGDITETVPLWNERPNIEINNRKTSCSMPPPRHYHGDITETVPLWNDGRFKVPMECARKRKQDHDMQDSVNYNLKKSRFDDATINSNLFVEPKSTKNCQYYNMTSNTMHSQNGLVNKSVCQFFMKGPFKDGRNQLRLEQNGAASHKVTSDISGILALKDKERNVEDQYLVDEYDSDECNETVISKQPQNSKVEQISHGNTKRLLNSDYSNKNPGYSKLNENTASHSQILALFPDSESTRLIMQEPKSHKISPPDSYKIRTNGSDITVSKIKAPIKSYQIIDDDYTNSPKTLSVKPKSDSQRPNSDDRPSNMSTINILKSKEMLASRSTAADTFRSPSILDKYQLLQSKHKYLNTCQASTEKYDTSNQHNTTALNDNASKTLKRNVVYSPWRYAKY